MSQPLLLCPQPAKRRGPARPGRPAFQDSSRLPRGAPCTGPPSSPAHGRRQALPEANHTMFDLDAFFLGRAAVSGWSSNGG